MIRRLSRTAVPVVAATVLAALFAQPILAAKPAISDTHESGPSGGIASLAQSTCGVTVASAYSILDTRTITYPAGASSGLVSIVHSRQRFEITTTSGATARVAQAGTFKTYRRGGHTFVEFSGRNLQVGIAGRVLLRDGAQIARTGKAVTFASVVCPLLARSAMAAGHDTAHGSQSDTAHGSDVAPRGDPRAESESVRGRSQGAHLAKLAR